MKVAPTRLAEVLLIEPEVREDERGFFLESWREDRYAEAGFPSRFVQDNHSRSVQGTVPGLHYQLRRPQGKLVRVVTGAVLDVAADIRRGSPTFGQWVGVTLSRDNRRQLYGPPGFAHGFAVLEGPADLLYKCTDYYHPGDDRGVRWNDPTLAIDWRVREPILSHKDAELPLLSLERDDLPFYDSKAAPPVTRFTRRNVLVTGGAGFIGCNFVAHLLRDPGIQRAVTLDLLTYAGRRENLDPVSGDPRHHFIHGDIRDRELVERLFRTHEIDTVVHFAAESHVDRSISGPAPFIDTNVMGTFILLEVARAQWLDQQKWDGSRCRFHHISTDEVFGSLGPEDPPFTEETPYAPNSPYAASKAAADHLVRAYGNTYGLPVVTTNWSNNYGPYQHPEKFIPTVIRSCLAGEPIPVYGDGGNVRDWLYVTDHCRGIGAVLRGGVVGSTYVIGGRTERRNVEIVGAICQALAEVTGRPAEEFRRLTTFVTDRLGHDRRYAINPAKIQRELGWTPKETFETGIRRTVEWYHDSGVQAQL